MTNEGDISSATGERNILGFLNLSFFWQDFIAGLCVAGLLLPEAVAYAGLAHLPVVHALTATMAGLAIYALFGGSRFAIVAPTSSTATLSAAAAVSLTGTFGAMSSVAYGQAIVALVLLTGTMLIVLGLARQGQLSSFISRPVLRGFAFALAVTIVIKQLPDATGIALPLEVASDPGSILFFTVSNWQSLHAPSIVVAVAAALLIAGLKRWPQVPASLLAIVLAISAAHWFDLAALGVKEIGMIARPEMHLGLPDLPYSEWLRLAEVAFGLVILVFAESWGSMRTMALPHGDKLDANRELLVLGACNVGTALMQGMAVGAGFSATSANASSGAITRKAGFFALSAIVGALLFALPTLHLLPRPVLAVAVINALWHALSAKPLMAVWKMNRDRVLIVGAALAVLFLGVLDGMLAAIALSMLAALRRFSQPVLHELGELDSSRNFVDIKTQQGASAVAGLLILRPEEPLFFGSAERVMTEVLHRVDGQGLLSAVVLSLEESADLDSTAIECLMELNHSLQLTGKSLVLARVKTTVRELMIRLDPQGLGRDGRMFWSVADAVQSLRGEKEGANSV